MNQNVKTKLADLLKICACYKGCDSCESHGCILFIRTALNDCVTFNRVLTACGREDMINSCELADEHTTILRNDQLVDHLNNILKRHKEDIDGKL